MNSVEHKIKKVMSDILRVPIDAIGENTSPETVGKWDSLGQMNLVLALEEAFDTTFSAEEIVEMLSYPLILSVLEKHGHGENG